MGFIEDWLDFEGGESQIEGGREVLCGMGLVVRCDGIEVVVVMLVGW